MRNIFFLLCFAFASTSFAEQVIQAQPGDKIRVNHNVVVEVKDNPKHPVKQSNCIKRSPSGRCEEYDYSYTVSGVSCVEDCLEFDRMGGCSLRNKCHYDERSGCFTRKTCIARDSVNDCNEWESSVICP
jgi:hypothetical protein